MLRLYSMLECQLLYDLKICLDLILPCKVGSNSNLQGRTKFYLARSDQILPCKVGQPSTLQGRTIFYLARSDNLLPCKVGPTSTLQGRTTFYLARLDQILPCKVRPPSTLQDFDFVYAKALILHKVQRYLFLYYRISFDII